MNASHHFLMDRRFVYTKSDILLKRIYQSPINYKQLAAAVVI